MSKATAHSTTTKRVRVRPCSESSVSSIRCLVNLHKMPITRFEMTGDRVGFRRARARRQVLEVIASKTNPDGTGSYVSDNYIVSKTGFERRHSIRLRQELRDLGLLDWMEGRGFRGVERGWGSNQYTVSVRENWPRRGEVGKVFVLNSDISSRETGLNGDISGVESRHMHVAQPPSLPKEREPLGRPSQDARSTALETQAERQYKSDLKKLRKSTNPPARGRPADPLRAELWDGIYGKRIENVFFDSRHLLFEEQLRACIESAITDLVNNRRGKMMHVSAEEIAKSALEKLNGAEAVRLVKDFGDRANACAIAVRNAVVYAAANLYDKQFPRARSRSSAAG
jgi:hypothetical protein